MPSQKNKQIVALLTEEIKKAQAVFLADYSGLSASYINDLRQRLKQTKARLMVVKNRLFKLAVKNTNPNALTHLDQDKALEGTSAAVFAYDDIINPLKVITDFIKETNSNSPKFKAGFDKNTYYPVEQVEQLTTLPDKSTLQAQVVGALQAPLYGLVNSLSWHIKELVWVLNSIKESKQS